MTAASANFRFVQKGARLDGMSDQATGLRERKKQATREALARAGLELFCRQGYDETTLAEIADAAGVSTRTIFAYFPSKEDILFATLDVMRDALVRALADRPAGTDALAALRDFIVSSAHEKTELDRSLGRVIAADQTLASHKRARIAELQEVLASAIADERGDRRGDRPHHLVRPCGPRGLASGRSSARSPPSSARPAPRSARPRARAGRPASARRRRRRGSRRAGAASSCRGSGRSTASARAARRGRSAPVSRRAARRSARAARRRRGSPCARLRR